MLLKLEMKKKKEKKERKKRYAIEKNKTKPRMLAT